MFTCNTGTTLNSSFPNEQAKTLSAWIKYCTSYLFGSLGSNIALAICLVARRFGELTA